MILTSEIKTNLKENLEKLYVVVNKNKSKPYDKDKITFANIKGSSVVQFFSYLFEQEYFEHFIDKLLSITKIKDNFSRRYLNNKLWEILHKFLNLKKEELEKAIENEINILEQELSKIMNQKWLIIFPIENIRITDDKGKKVKDSFLLGDTKIYGFNDKTTRDIKKKLGIKLIFTEYEDLNGKICIDIEIKAGESEKAKEKGYAKLEDILSILRFFAPWVEIDAEGKLSCKGVFIKIINLETKQVYTSSFSGRKLITNNYALHKSYYDSLLKHGLKAINEMYLSDHGGDFKIQILDAIHWYGSAVKEGYDRDKFIKLTICLETLLKKKNEKEEITKTISERLALLVGQHFDERKKLLSEMKKLYGIRSAIVHRGKRNVEENKLNRLFMLVHDAIRNSLYKYKEEYSFDNFINDIDDIKMKWEETSK